MQSWWVLLGWPGWLVGFGMLLWMNLAVANWLVRRKWKRIGDEATNKQLLAAGWSAEQLPSLKERMQEVDKSSYVLIGYFVLLVAFAIVCIAGLWFKGPS